MMVPLNMCLSASVKWQPAHS